MSDIKLEDNITGGMPDMTPEETEAFFNQQPTRAEVANYVNALIEHHVMPDVIERINRQTVVVNTILAVLVTKGIVTPEELQKVTAEVEKELQAQAEQQVPNQDQEQA